MDNNNIESNQNALPIKQKMKLNLRATTPSGYPISLLGDQLRSIGLKCSETTDDKLTQYKADVLSDYKVGTRAAYCVYKTSRKQMNANMQLFDENGDFLLRGDEFMAAIGAENTNVVGSWTLNSEAGGYREELNTIIYAKHFDYLFANFKDTFSGTKKSELDVIENSTGEAIKRSFKKISIAVCGTVFDGIKKEDLESIVSTILAGKNDSDDPHDFEKDDVLNIYLVNGYDPVKKVAEAAGVLSISFIIHITDYRDKTDTKDDKENRATVTVTARFISYSDESYMERDLNRITSYFKANLFQPVNIIKSSDFALGTSPVFDFDSLPIEPGKVEVYSNRPPATKKAFYTGLPLVKTGIYADSVIFYCPDIEMVGCLDNSNSDVTSTYSKSITTGFEETNSITISAETSLELNYEVVKAGFKLGVSMTLSSTWNISHTESMTFQLGGRSIAFLYQGLLCSVILRYDPEKREYYYVETSTTRFLSNVLKTSSEPIVASLNTRKLL